MRVFRDLWNDEFGVLLSAEAVVVGTVVVVGLTTGLTVVTKAVSEELTDVAKAIRSLDQSYSIPARERCDARTAGSSFTQEPVEKSLEELNEFTKETEKKERTQAERLKEKVEKQRKPDDRKVRRNI